MRQNIDEDEIQDDEIWRKMMKYERRSWINMEESEEVS
jgi:hypothetical protein